MIKGLLFCIILMALLVPGGCQHLQSPPFASQQAEKGGLYDIAIPDDIEKEMESLAAGMIIYSTDQERALVHLRMAVLCSHYKNASPDYERALKELETYRDLDPVGAMSNEILQIRNYLEMIITVKNDNEKLRSSVSQLKHDVDDMKESLEKLKSLDVMMEEKRRKVQ